MRCFKAALVAALLFVNLQGAYGAVQILVGDSLHGNVQRFDASGNSLGSFGEGVVFSPKSFTADSNGVLYVACASASSGKIEKFDLASGTYAGNLYTAMGPEMSPDGIAFAPDGRLYVSIKAGLNRFDFDPTFGPYYVGYGMGKTSGVTVGPDGALYVCSGGLSYTGLFRWEIGGVGQIISQSLNFSIGRVACAPDGSIYFAGNSGGKIYKWGYGGVFNLLDTLPGAASGLTSIACGPDGSLYAVSEAISGIYRFDTSSNHFAAIPGTAILGSPTSIMVMDVVPEPGSVLTLISGLTLVSGCIRVSRRR